MYVFAIALTPAQEDDARHEAVVQKLLVLHGPAGAGKTATLKVLASEFDAEIVEYVNSSTATFMGDTGVSSSVSSLRVHAEGLPRTIAQSATRRWRRSLLSCRVLPLLQP